jgi:hypothetical protein
VASFAEIYRKFRKPYRVRWSDFGPPRLESNASGFNTKAQYGSLVDRVVRIFQSMDDETRDRVLEKYRQRYGDGGYAYAKRTIASWQNREVQQVGLTVIRLLEVVPLFVDKSERFFAPFGISSRISPSDSRSRANQCNI